MSRLTLNSVAWQKGSREIIPEFIHRPFCNKQKDSAAPDNSLNICKDWNDNQISGIMKKLICLWCCFLVFGCKDEELKNPLTGNYSFHFESSHTDPFKGAPPYTTYWSSDSVGQIVERTRNILVVKSGLIPDFEVEVNNKELSARYDEIEGHATMHYVITGKFDSLNNVSLEYLKMAEGGSFTIRYSITGVKLN
jgi:hypothetical protein